MTSIHCPAVFLAAPASGQGKTTITAALARFHRLQGREVRIFKMGPDYLDPLILAQASGHEVAQLDMWMAGEEYCRQQFYEAAKSADLILVEGAMGLFDGQPSSADLAARFGIPVALVMDVKGMAQTAAALAWGLVNYRSDVHFLGLIANRCASERHRQLIDDALPTSLPLLGHFAFSEELSLPERHLGLVQASEIRDLLELRFNAAAKLVGQTDLAHLPPPVIFSEQSITAPQALLSGLKIGLARDEAFSFIYPANTRLLLAMGAQIVEFSPLHDQCLPEVDALWLPGGYPELHASILADNTAMLNDIQQFHLADKAILAECGGFMYCLENLTDLSKRRYKMLGLLSGEASMRDRGGCQGMQIADLPEGEVRAHAHHRSQVLHTPEPISFGRRPFHPTPGEAIYRHGSLTASYLHLFFPSNPAAIAALFLPQPNSLQGSEA
jgi:cobyrinic acid a,c-diamide synthase